MHIIIRLGDHGSGDPIPPTVIPGLGRSAGERTPLDWTPLGALTGITGVPGVTRTADLPGSHSSEIEPRREQLL